MFEWSLKVPVCLTIPNKSANTMAFRRAVNLFRKESFYSLWRPRFQESSIIRQTVNLNSHSGTNTRTFYTGTQLMVAKLVSVEELFARKSLQEYLKKIETEYSECLREINSSAMEEQRSDDELRTKRTKVFLLTSLIQAIRELDSKIKESQETEMLLKGKTALLLPHKSKDCLNVVLFN